MKLKGRFEFVTSPGEREEGGAGLLEGLEAPKFMEGLRPQRRKELLAGPANWHLEGQAGEEAYAVPSDPQSPPLAPRQWAHHPRGTSTD